MSLQTVPFDKLLEVSMGETPTKLDYVSRTVEQAKLLRNRIMDHPELFGGLDRNQLALLVNHLDTSFAIVVSYWVEAREALVEHLR